MTTKSGYLEVDAWINRKWYEEHDEEFKQLTRSLKAVFGKLDVAPVKSFLWSAMTKDCKANGFCCLFYLSRFEGNKYQRLVCPQCLEDKILITSDRSFENYVYALYAVGEAVPCYIGVTKNPQQRFVAHLGDKEFSTMMLLAGFDDRKAAEAYETKKIWEYKPRYNKKIVAPVEVVTNE